MSNFLIEISRIHELMGIKTPINESLLHNKILLKEGTGIGEIMDIYKSIFKKGAVELTEEESKYLRNLVDEYNLRFPNSKIEFVNGLDNLSFRKLSDFITKQGDEILNDFFGSLSKNIYRKEISELGIKGFLSLDQAFRNLMKSEKIINGLTDSSGEVISIYDHINYIYQKGGIKNSDLPDSILTVLKDELEYLIKDPKKLGTLSNDDPFKKYCSDIVSQIDETQNSTVAKVDPEIPLKVKEIQDTIPPNVNNIEDVPVNQTINKTDNVNINFKSDDKTILDVFKKDGIFYKEGIELIRGLTDKFLKDYQKLYLDGVSQKEIQDYQNALNLLKQRFGEGKIYSQSLQDGSKTKKLTVNDFTNEVENSFKRLYDENGNFSPLNKLDTNWTDMPIELTKFIKTVLSSTEYNNFIKKIQDYVNAVDNTEKLKLKTDLDKEFENIKVKLNQNENYVKNWTKRVDEITKNIKKNTDSGNLSEQKVNELFEKEGFKVEFTASEGSPIDVLLSIDQIVTDTKGIFGGGQKTVQTKTAGKISEGEFQIVEGKRTWVEKSGTNSYRVEVFPGQRISKQSQIDLAGFYDPNSGITIITGKQKGLSKTFDEKTKKMKIMYNTDKTPIYSNSEELPGSTLIKSKNSSSPYVAFIIDAETTKIVGR